MTTIAKRERIAEEREQEKCRVYDYCEENKIEMEFINDYQIRLNGKLDVYPTNKKFCAFQPRTHWGFYYSLEELCKKYL